jgi:hypothetical protein
MALLYRHLFKSFRPFFDENDSVRALGSLYNRLNQQMPGLTNAYVFAGIDRLDQIVEAAIPKPAEKPNEVNETQ